MLRNPVNVERTMAMDEKEPGSGTAHVTYPVATVSGYAVVSAGSGQQSPRAGVMRENVQQLKCTCRACCSRTACAFTSRDRQEIIAPQSGQMVG